MDLSYVNLPDFSEDPSMRINMFTSVVQSVFLGIALLFIAQAFKKYCLYAFTFVFCIICFCSIISNHAFQAKGGIWNNYLTFDQTKRAYQALHKAMPTHRENANAFFVILPEDEPSHFGWGYSLYHAGNAFYGISGYQGRMTLDGKLEQRFMTGHAKQNYDSTPDCHFIVFRAYPGQDVIELVSTPSSTKSKNTDSCMPSYTDILPNASVLPYFNK